MNHRYPASTPDLDMTPRYAPTTVVVNGGSAPVVQSKVHPPGLHSRSPIRDEMTALELVTEHGSSWYGCQAAWINSESKMVVIGIDPRDEVRMKWKVVSG